MMRRSAIAGSWYPGSAPVLTAALDAYLAAATDVPGTLAALVAPHAGLKYSGPVAAYAYKLLASRSFERVVLVGPSHFVAFDGVAAFPGGAFQTPLGAVEVDAEFTGRVVGARDTPVFEDAAVHAREHSLEMQLPFIQRMAPSARIVALLMGEQTADTARRLADVLVRAAAGSAGTLLVASSDLSHYHEAATAHRLDGVVLECLTRFDPEALQDALERNPGHACGGGPIVSVLAAARRLGARESRVLRYADSGDVSGDKTAVVGYAAAAVGTFGDRAAVRGA